MDRPRSSLCGPAGVPVVDLGSIPIHVGALWESREAARACPRGPFALAYCEESGLIYNDAFDARLADYGIPYDNALHHSEVFQRFEDELVERLAGPGGVQGGRVAEIGAGTGRFLARLCERGHNVGVGVDPSHEPVHADPLLAGRAEVRREPFEGSFPGPPPDLVVMRHVLEHVADPLELMRGVRAGLGPGSTARIYVEVPNGLLTIRRLSVWDLIYEHATYFVVPSLERLLAAAGFAVTTIDEVYDAQFVAAEAQAVDEPWSPPARSEELAALAADVQAFPSRLERRVAEWRSRLGQGGDSGPLGLAVAWGAGAKAVGFFNLLGVSEEIPAIVDLNPRKQGHFLPGSGQPIVPPESLADIRPRSVIVMNPIYADEIAAHVHGMGLDAEIVPVGARHEREGEPMESPATTLEDSSTDRAASGGPSCRNCGEGLRHTFADLGAAPFGESFVAPSDLNRAESFYPLKAWVCQRCFLVQLEELVDPAEIFHVSAFASAMSDAWVAHAADYCRTTCERLGLGHDHSVIELASNDGTVLSFFKERGIEVLGIDPAANVAAMANERGVPTLVEYFEEEVGQRVAREHGRADLLLANNVLGHVSRLHSFIAGMRHLLAEDGVFTIETPYLLPIIEGNQFDTIYHEHFSLFSLHSLSSALAAHDLEVIDVEELWTHGGSLRVYGAHRGDRRPSERVRDQEAKERSAGLDRLDTYVSFEEYVRETKRALLQFLIEAKREGKRIVGYGAPGKASTLLNYCGIRQDFVDFVVDRNPYKQGRLMPGTRIPIHPVERLAEAKPDYVLILPVNWRDEIMETAAYIREWGGRFLVHIPRVEVI